MRLFPLTIILCLALTNPVFALQAVFTGGSDDTHATNTEYMSPFGGSVWHGSEVERRGLIPTSGYFGNLSVRLRSDVGAGNTSTFTLMVNGVATAATCTIENGTGQTCSDDTNTVTVSVGDTFSLKVVPVSSPTSSNVWSAINFFADDESENIIASNSDDETSRSDGITEYMSLNGDALWGATEADFTTMISTASTAKKLYIAYNLGPGLGAGETRAFTLMLNGSATSLTCTVSANESTCNDTTNTVSIAAGDLVSLRIVTVGDIGGNHVGWGIVFDVGTEGKFITTVLGATNSDTATVYQNITQGRSGWGTVAIDQRSGTTAVTMSTICASLATAPGAGKSFVFQDASFGTATALVVTLSDSEIHDCYSEDITIGAKGAHHYISIPSNTPTASRAFVGMIGSFTPTPTGAQDRRSIFSSGTGTATFSTGTGTVLF